MNSAPRLLFTMGDVAGIGPEVLARAWPELTTFCTPVVVGDIYWMERALELMKVPATVQQIANPAEAQPTAQRVACIQGTTQKLRAVVPGRIGAEAGRAAYDFLVAAIDMTLQQEADGIVTLPLHKEGLHLAGLKYPGHTEILAERTGTGEFAMMLYARGNQVPHGLGVVHVTLHMALHDIFRHLSIETVLEKIRLLQGVMRRLCDHPPRLAVAALNPHASDGGLFGHEERTILSPAVALARGENIQVEGPIPSDTLFVRAQRGEFDGIVALYHDQGHIPLKLLSGLQAVNISVGLPIVRTSVAHGTAYDIAGQGSADHHSLLEAARVAAQPDKKPELILIPTWRRRQGETVMKTTLYLIRQAATEANLMWPRQRQGRGQNPPLARLGVRQAELTRDFLAVRPIDHCYCSPRLRAVQTASILAAPHGLSPFPLEGIVDCDLGSPEHPEGESFAEVQARVTRTLEELLARHAGQALLIVAHHDIHRIYLAGLLGMNAEQSRQVQLDNCGISVVVREGNKTTVSTLNASFHLQGIAA